MARDPGKVARDPGKVARRAALRERRRTIAGRRDASSDGAELACRVEQLADVLGLRAGDTVASYEAVAGEPATAAAHTALRARGIRVLLPVTEPGLDLDWADAAQPAVALGRHAIADAALVLTPGLAVDRAGTRLGQGGGCYDRALPRRRAGAPVVALLHPGELLAPDDDPLPREAHDVPVDAVLTADGLEMLPSWPAR
ncbi:MAG: 5-formyltetrahydrofolate cyclo-ligase [Dermatophilaceae bacterium]